ncbi:MAG: ABC transporter ATP-binding protein [Bacillota bacterium]
MKSIMEIRGLRKEVPMGGVPLAILKGVDLQVREGEFLAIMGPSGSGKSTLLGLMAGLDTASAGSITLAGTEITRLGEDAMARLRGRLTGIVFQAFHLIPTLTALENVALPLELAGRGRATDPARQALTQVGLAHRLHHYPRQLSGGEQQRVAIARAIATRPPVLFADEPTGNLDSQSGRAVMELLLRQNREAGATLIMVTHDPQLAALSDRTIFMQDGVLIREEVHPRDRLVR